MKILKADEMALLEEATAERVGIPMRTVMESAGRELVSFLLQECTDRLRSGVLVLAGAGNNGGDGFVVARSLLNLGVWAEVALVKPLDSLKGDARASAESFLQCSGKLLELNETNWSETECISRLGNFGIVVDALYGTGLSGAVRGFVAELISFVNARARSAGVPIVAIDIPSGVEADTGAVHGPSIEAQATLALQCLKLGHVLYPGSGYCGKIFLADIGLPTILPEITSVDRELLTEDSVSALLSEHLLGAPDEHKGSRGHVLVIGGSAGRFGAPKLSGHGALSSGAGLATLVLPETAAAQVAPLLEELMCESLPAAPDGGFSGEGLDKLESLLEGKQAVVFGPGVGVASGAKEILASLLALTERNKQPLVIDADGLNILSTNPKFLETLHARVVLTPHPGEMARLNGRSSSQVQEDRLRAATELSQQCGCWVVLKGARTVVSGPLGQISINPAATLTLATAGSGDLLAGIVGAFLAKGFPPGEAACAAVFVHGCAGEASLLDSGGIIGTLAGDISIQVPLVINALLRLRPESLLLSRMGLSRMVLPGGMQRLREMLGYTIV